MALGALTSLNIPTHITTLEIRGNQWPAHSPLCRLLLIRDLDAVPQTLNLELLTGGSSVDVLDIVGGGLEVGGGVVALGDEDVVLSAVLEGLGDGDGSTLVPMRG